MSLVDVLVGVNYGLVFFFGAYLMVSFVGGCRAQREWVLFFAVYCPVCLALQTISWLVFGLKATKQIYPLIVHLPMLSVLTLGLKMPLTVSVVSICTGYLCCQLPRFGEIIVTAATGSELAGQIAYLIIIAPIFFLLQRYYVPSARDTMHQSPKYLLLFGGLPIVYYAFDYTTAIYSDLLYSGSRVVAEILPTAMVLLYMVYTTAYRQQLQRQSQAELVNSLMAGQLKQAEAEMASLRQAETQAATYQHDMRHHLAAINAFLAAQKPQQAEEYIRHVQEDIEAITPKRFCENELVNLLCSSFSAKAERMDVRLSIEADLPGELAVSDTELCALLSNGMENALNAAAALDRNRRWTEVFCGMRANKLLIEIRNPCAGQIQYRGGLPASTQPGHGNGCRSIHTITRACRGLCEFRQEDGIFILRVALPVKPGRTPGLSRSVP